MNHLIPLTYPSTSEKAYLLLLFTYKSNKFFLHNVLLYLNLLHVQASI